MKLVVTGTVECCAQHVALGAVVVQQGVGGEAGEVQLLGRVGHRRRDPGRQHLVERRVVLAPEGGAPGVVELLDVAVPVGEPAAEGRGRHVAPAPPVVAAQLVGHVPQPHRRVPTVAARHLLDERQRVLAEHRRAGAPRLPAARPQRVPGVVDREDLRVGDGQPRRGCGRRRGHVDGDAAVGQQLDDLVEPAEVELARPRLQERPREHAERHEPDTGRLHEPHVLAPHRARPLLGVVVAAQRDAVERVHPFVLPSVRPDTNCRCSAKKMINTGSMASTEPAESRL